MGKNSNISGGVSGLLVKPTERAIPANCSDTPEGKQVAYYRYYMDGFKRGVNTSKLIDEFVEKYGVDKRTALIWRNKTLEALSFYAVKDADQIRNIQMERLEHIYNLAVEARQLKTAQSILDTMNKLAGLYKENNIIINPVTEFSFGGVDNKKIIVSKNPYDRELRGVDGVDEINAKAEEIIEDLNGFKWSEESS